MSFMKGLLSSIGIGAATVDTILFKNQFAQGETIKGTVTIKGGSIEQQIDEIYVSVQTDYKSDDSVHTVNLNQQKLSQPFTIAPNEKKEFPLSIDLPYHTPLTMGKSKIWLETGLDIKSALDPSDRDYIKVVPGELLAPLFQAVEQLGFRTRKIETERAPYNLQHLAPIAQKFEYVPYNGPFQGKLDELEISPIVQANQVTAFMEIDRRSQGLGGLFSEMLDLDETRVRMIYNTGDIPNLREILYQKISHWS